MADAEEEGQSVNVQVAVRVRPMNSRETQMQATNAVEFPSSSQIVLAAKGENHPFQFDHVFPPDGPQESVYLALGVPLIEKAFAGFNSTIFAYGQTGSGKTHTMMNIKAADPEHLGLVPRISHGLYQRIEAEQAQHETRRFLVCASFLEIYNEVISDLLAAKGKQSKGGLEIKEQKGLGVYVKDLTEVVVESADKLNQLVESGFGQRVTAATKMNDSSSRSHCIFIIKVHQKDASDEAKNTFSKLNLVDLAGSERAKSTEAEGDRLKEGANINKSLSALGNVINALSSAASGSKKVFVPYRNSKLTRVLQESLGGNSLCTMVAACSPVDINSDETLSTLNYAKRAKTIKVTATKNEEASQIRRLEDEVSALRRKLESQAGAGLQVELNAKEKQELESKYETQIEELQSFMKQSWEDKQKLSVQYEEDQRRAAEEKLRAAERVRTERKRRLQLLEQNGDIQLSLQSLSALGSKLCLGWPDKIADALKVEQHLRSQLRAVRMFRDSAGADFAMWWGRRGGDAVPMMTLLGQSHTKLRSMAKELEKLAAMESQLEGQFGHISPEVALALRNSQGSAPSDAAPDDEEGQAAEELVEHLALVQRQLSEHHEKARAFLRAERAQLGFGEELGRLRDVIAEQPLAPGTEGDSDSLRDILAAAAAAAGDSAGCAASAAGEVPKPLGLSTFELGDDSFSASSNAAAAASGRLLQAVGYGGWCPAANAAEEYLEVNLGAERQVTGLSLQGRVPLTREWQHTRDLLKLAVAGDPLPSADGLPTQEKFYKRPPVRLVHDVGVWFGSKGGWDVPEELMTYGDLSRELKVSFFDELIRNVNLTVSRVDPEGQAAVTSAEVLGGKNCEETNKLLQIIACLSLKITQPSSGDGLGDVAPQWTTRLALEYCNDSGAWQWLAAAGGAGVEAAHQFEGCDDALTVKSISLPEPIVASRLRVHPLEWHRHAALRLEVYTISKNATVALAGGGAGGPKDSPRVGTTLEESLGIVCQGVVAVQKNLEAEHAAKLKDEEDKNAQVMDQKERAEGERDQLDIRLQDALARIEELEGQSAENLQRAVDTETTLLQTQVDRDQLTVEKEDLEKDLAKRTEEKSDGDEKGAVLQDDLVEMTAAKEDVESQLQIMTEERDFARAKEEEHFEMLTAKDEELVDTNNGYVYLTERLQEKEEEMEEMDRQAAVVKEANDKLLERTQELQEELLTLQGERQALRAQVAEKERLHKSAEERYMRLLKDGIGAPAVGIGSRPTSAVGGRAHGPAGGASLAEATSLAASGSRATPRDAQYEEDFDDDDDAPRAQAQN